MSLAGAGTLFRKEVLRFWKVAFQTVAAPVLTAIMYLLILATCCRIRCRPSPVWATPASWCRAW
jgi:hypothetical protein